MIRRELLLLGILLVSLTTSVKALPVNFIENQVINSVGNATQMVWSKEYNTIVTRNSGSAIRIINTLTGQTTNLQFSTNTFMDMDITQNGRYVYATDFGGHRTGYGTPVNQHYIHRYDMVAESWSVAEAPMIAGKIEAVSDNNFLLLERDQWVDITLNEWTGSGVVEVDRVHGDYYGDFEYNSLSGRIIHGNSGSSSREINAWRLNGDNIVAQESSGTYGSAQSGGGTAVLSNDGMDFYYGRLQVEALDVSNNQRMFDEAIFAATGDYAFGSNGVYSADTGALLGDLGFDTSVYALDSSGNNFWAFNPDDDSLHFYSEVPVPAAVWLFGSGLIGLIATARRKK